MAEARLELVVLESEAVTGMLVLQPQPGAEFGLSVLLKRAGFKEGDRVVLVPAPPAPLRTKCVRCQADVVMLPTTSGRVWAVDVETFEAGDTVIDVKKHRSHLMTCPDERPVPQNPETQERTP